MDIPQTEKRNWSTYSKVFAKDPVMFDDLGIFGNEKKRPRIGLTIGNNRTTKALMPPENDIADSLTQPHPNCNIKLANWGATNVACVSDHLQAAVKAVVQCLKKDVGDGTLFEPHVVHMGHKIVYKSPIKTIMLMECYVRLERCPSPQSEPSKELRELSLVKRRGNRQNSLLLDLKMEVVDDVVIPASSRVNNMVYLLSGSASIIRVLYEQCQSEPELPQTPRTNDSFRRFLSTISINSLSLSQSLVPASKRQCVQSVQNFRNKFAHSSSAINEDKENCSNSFLASLRRITKPKAFATCRKSPVAVMAVSVKEDETRDDGILEDVLSLEDEYCGAISTKSSVQSFFDLFSDVSKASLISEGDDTFDDISCSPDDAFFDENDFDDLDYITMSLL